MSNVIEILKYSGPISLTDLSDRISSPPRELVVELKGLEKEGLVEIKGPLGASVDQAFTPDNEEATALTTVELSGRGLKFIMA